MKKHYKILIVTDAWQPQVNGVVRTYEHLEEELTRKGHEILIIGPSSFPKRYAMPGYTEIELVAFPYRRLARMIDNFDPDLIHIATEGPLGWAARRYCLQHKRDFVTAYHTQFPAYVARRVGKFLPFLESFAYRLADRIIRRFHAKAKSIIVTTPSLAAELIERGYKTPLHCMIRGVPTDLFQPGPATLFEEHPGPIALYVGRVAIEKNLEDFLHMVWEGTKVVVGHGPSLADFQRRFPDVVFPGVKTGEALAACYQSADIFVFPSKTDTFGIVLIEALACGLPVAAYDVTGPRDIINDPILGALTTDNLSEAAQEALALRKSSTERHEFVATNYSWARAADEFLAIMTEAETI